MKMMNNWLRHNVGSIIALAWTISAIVFFYILLKNGDKDVMNTVENIIILILGYYFGSTRTMNDKMRSDFEKDNTNTNQSNN